MKRYRTYWSCFGLLLVAACSDDGVDDAPGQSSGEESQVTDSGGGGETTMVASEHNDAGPIEPMSSEEGDTGAGSGVLSETTSSSVAPAGDAGDTADAGCPEDGSQVSACVPDESAVLQQALDDIVRADLLELGALGMGVTVEFPDGRHLESSAGVIAPEESAAAYDVGATKQVIGSVTKLFTTVLVLQLVEEGALGLEETIAPWFDFDDADEITVRMLLQHTSGLADCLTLMPEERTAEVSTPEQLVQLATDADRVSEKGGAAFYSNTNFAILASIVESVTGKSWQDNLEERITAPLGLSETFYAGDARGAEGLVDGWVNTEGGWVGALQFTHPSVGWGYGALTSTNRELARFGKALFDGDLFADDATLAAALEFTAEMDPAALSDGEPSQSVGLGVLRYHLDGFDLDGHLGHILGYHSAILRDPDTGVTLTGTANTEGAIVAITLVKIAQALRGL